MNGLSGCLWNKKVFASTLLKRSRGWAPLFLAHSKLPSSIREIAVHCFDKDALETPEKWALKIKLHHLIILWSNLQTGKWALSPLWSHALFSTFFPSRIARNASRIFKERGQQEGSIPSRTWYRSTCSNTKRGNDSSSVSDLTCLAWKNDFFRRAFLNSGY